MDLGLDNIALGAGRQDILSADIEVGTDRTSIRLDAMPPNYGRFLAFAVPNPVQTTWPYNYVVVFGINMKDNTEQRDPSAPAAGWSAEGNYADAVPTGQAELYGWVKWNGKNRRPWYAAYDLNADEMEVQLRGRTVFTKEDASGTLVTINPRAISRRMSVAPDFQLATTTSTDPVKIRGVQIEGTSDSCFTFPRRVVSDTRPTIPVGASCRWWNASAGELKILDRDAAGGYRSVLLTAEA